jgi:sugar phosphate isomerase/epimerase
MNWKPTLHSVSYAGVWPGQARLTLDDFLERARRLGFETVMLMTKRPHLSPLDFDADARGRLRDRVAGLGLRVVCLAGYNDFCMGADRPDVPSREMQVLYLRELCRLAADLGCPLVRVFTGFNHAAASYDQQWGWCVASLKECARFAVDVGVTLAVQNHHDVACHFESLRDLLDEVDSPACKAAFDAWSPALHGSDLAAGVRLLGPHIVHTTVADYVRRPRFHYLQPLVNYARETDAIRAVPPGEGFIDYAGFFRALREVGYRGHVAYEMCSPLRGGGGEENLDRCARGFLKWIEAF